jgi:hypothetical protein
MKTDRADRKKWLDALGKRVIVRENMYSPLIEAKVKEVSERYVKLHFVENSVNRWCDYGTYNLCEILPERDEGVPIAPNTPQFNNEMYKEIERRMIEKQLAGKPILCHSHKGDIVNSDSGNSLRHDFK